MIPALKNQGSIEVFEYDEKEYYRVLIDEKPQWFIKHDSTHAIYPLNRGKGKTKSEELELAYNHKNKKPDVKKVLDVSTERVFEMMFEAIKNGENFNSRDVQPNSDCNYFATKDGKIYIKFRWWPLDNDKKIPLADIDSNQVTIYNPHFAHSHFAYSKDIGEQAQKRMLNKLCAELTKLHNHLGMTYQLIRVGKEPILKVTKGSNCVIITFSTNAIIPIECPKNYSGGVEITATTMPYGTKCHFYSESEYIEPGDILISNYRMYYVLDCVKINKNSGYPIFVVNRKIKTIAAHLYVERNIPFTFLPLNEEV